MLCISVWEHGRLVGTRFSPRCQLVWLVTSRGTPATSTDVGGEGPASLGGWGHGGGTFDGDGRSLVPVRDGRTDSGIHLHLDG
jgi:hypothetical protein